jgi:hypothetical protein
VRPARRKDDLVQAGLLARGSSLFSAFPGFALQNPVALGKGLTADSCGGSFGFGLSSENGKPHRIPSWLVNATSTPELGDCKPSLTFCQWLRLYFVRRCDISSDDIVSNLDWSFGTFGAITEFTRDPDEAGHCREMARRRTARNADASKSNALRSSHCPIGEWPQKSDFQGER